MYLFPDLNDSREQLLRLKRLLQGYTCIETVEFLPFRKLCGEKYQTLQIEFPFAKYREGNREDIERANLDFYMLISLLLMRAHTETYGIELFSYHKIN